MGTVLESASGMRFPDLVESTKRELNIYAKYASITAPSRDTQRHSPTSLGDQL